MKENKEKVTKNINHRKIFCQSGNISSINGKMLNSNNKGKGWNINKRYNHRKIMKVYKIYLA